MGRYELREVTAIHADPRNARLHSDEQVQKLCASITAFGFNNPCLVDPDGLLIAGEGRWRAARRLGMAEVPVIVLDHLSPAQREAYALADNRLAEDAAWDETKLAAVVKDLASQDFGDLGAIGFDHDELGKLLEPVLESVGRKKGKGQAALDRAAPRPASPVTRPGDMWQLGRHRLICGDATERATYQRLFLAEKRARLVLADPPGAQGPDLEQPAELVVTDPPYGMSYGGGRAAGSSAPGARVKAPGMILNDDATGDRLVALVRDALVGALAFARKGAAAYVCFTWRTFSEFERAVKAAGLEIANCIVWNKESIGLGNSHYRPQHEFIFYCRGKFWNGGHDEADVWDFSRGATGEYVHPTQKPVSLIERAIQNSSVVGDSVLDMFAGSGSTLIACERLQRVARLVELDPKFCDAIVRRWEEFTGAAATRIPATAADEAAA